LRYKVFCNMKEHLEDLSEIRSMMERSTRFISLSGLSGIFAGLVALAGALVAYNRIAFELESEAAVGIYNNDLTRFLLVDALIVLATSISFALYFTIRRTRTSGQKLWGNPSRRLLMGMMIPLVSGGFFCLLLLQHAPQLLDSATLLFYGLALVNASQYTFDDTRFLGYAQITLGLACGLINQWEIGLLFWAIGFGILHIAYGIILYHKYES
jgi:hypothetical protein